MTTQKQVHDANLPDVNYADPGDIDGIKSTDLLTLIEAGDLLVRNSAGEFVPVEMASFWHEGSIINLTNGDIADEDGGPVILYGFAHIHSPLDVQIDFDVRIEIEPNHRRNGYLATVYTPTTTAHLAGPTRADILAQVEQSIKTGMLK